MQSSIVTFCLLSERNQGRMWVCKHSEAHKAPQKRAQARPYQVPLLRGGKLGEGTGGNGDRHRAHGPAVNTIQMPFAGGFSGRKNTRIPYF